MTTSHVVTAAIVAGAIVSVVAPSAAFADNLVLNQWYGGQFSSPGPLTGGVYTSLGTDGPTFPTGFANAVAAPASPWVISLTHPGTLTVTDVQASGDQFELFDNGVAMTPAASPFTGPGQNPGQSGQAGGFTSASTVGAYVGADINAALGNKSFSSGTFYLSPGANAITGKLLAANTQGPGDFDFVAASVPEPSTWAMILLGFAGFGVAGYRKSRARISIA
ncbi:putative secreted protein with PEP-CTERM sorting signal [Roseiarcus fermentans]|uniref:Putative secreted protein with PEP-CTERM sorting signal n=1 Tax=Roseiarcus fermentans TaxID=1473586 RepID=A0A366ET04_9HYPH|nr:PEP-CTERM sorting domain-containing protein [Roseiarcus fermentans]RBP04649.1 putative secreted protein with PEP-CTERM sorting signal [Roseiarcus fermentans]